MARVAVLLALFNGAAHLRAQLDSIAGQSHPDWTLIVSDDGSTDAGLALVQDFARENPARDVGLIVGPHQGFAANFLHLIAAAPPGMVALSDQDDVWLPEKLARGVAALAGETGPCLYCARTLITGPQLQPRGLSPVWPRAFGFRNALVQNVAAGNTILLNPQALALAQDAIGRLALAAGARIVAHDWFLYQLITGAGGRVIRDAEPVLWYRQHAGNAIGDNAGGRATLRRLYGLITGQFRAWNGRNIPALLALGDLLTPQSRQILQDFAAFRQAGVAARLAGLRRSGLYRQGRLGNAALWLSTLLGRI